MRSNLSGDSNHDGEDETAEATRESRSQSGHRIIMSASSEFLKKSEDEHGDGREYISDDLAGRILAAKSKYTED